MSTFVIHALIPSLVAASSQLFRPQTVWIWSWPAWAVDIDYVGWVLHNNYGWPNVHRALFHNVWWLLLAVGLAVHAWTRWRARGSTLADFVQARPGWVLVPFFYASHLLLDYFLGGLAFFWPVSSHSFAREFELTVNTRDAVPTVDVHSEAVTVPHVVDVSEFYTWLTGEQLAFLLLYGLSVGLVFAHRRWGARSALRP